MTTQSTDLRLARSAFSQFTDAVMACFEDFAYRRSRRDQIDALQAKSDAELKALGLTRDQIPHHVFRDLYYL